MVMVVSVVMKVMKVMMMLPPLVFALEVIMHEILIEKMIKAIIPDYGCPSASPGTFANVLDFVSQDSVFKSIRGLWDYLYTSPCPDIIGFQKEV